MKRLNFILQCAVLFLLAGCFSAPDAPTEGAGAQAPVTSKPTSSTSQAPSSVTSKPTSSTSQTPTSSTSQTPTSVTQSPAPADHGGWDDFPNKYKPTLLALNADARQLPAPFGTQYASIYATGTTGLQKAAAAKPACPGDSTVFKYQNALNDFFIYDTITYYDSTGIAHCGAPGGSRESERHIRRIVQVGVGEARETIRDSITDLDVLPRHTVHGTGSMVLESGLELAIQSYDMSFLAQFGTDLGYVLDANLELLYKDGYTIRLALAKPHPYKAIDFFPVNGLFRHELVMSGPITHPSANGGVDTLGYIDLFDDHALQVRDWTGARIAP